MNQALLYVIPSWRCSSWGHTPFLPEQSRCTAMSHLESGT